MLSAAVQEQGIVRLRSFDGPYSNVTRWYLIIKISKLKFNFPWEVGTVRYWLSIFLFQQSIVTWIFKNTVAMSSDQTDSYKVIS